MDPAVIGSSEWNEIDKLLSNFWAVVFFVILFATNMLLGHNLIPSLVASKDISNGWQKARPAFYTLALACLSVALFFLSRVVDYTGVLHNFWSDYWI